MFESALGFEILLIVGLILVNGIFAMSEIAVVSARKVRLQQRAEKGDAGARRALELIEHPTRFLSTVQIGITLVGVFAGAYGGASIAGQFDVYLERYPSIAAYSEEIALATVVASITFLSLVVGELVPKRIGLNHPERIASLVAGPMHTLSILASPGVRRVDDLAVHVGLHGRADQAGVSGRDRGHNGRHLSLGVHDRGDGGRGGAVDVLDLSLFRAAGNQANQGGGGDDTENASLQHSVISRSGLEGRAVCPVPSPHEKGNRQTKPGPVRHPREKLDDSSTFRVFWCTKPHKQQVSELFSKQQRGVH